MEAVSHPSPPTPPAIVPSTSALALPDHSPTPATPPSPLHTTPPSASPPATPPAASPGASSQHPIRCTPRSPAPCRPGRGRPHRRSLGVARQHGQHAHPCPLRCTKPRTSSSGCLFSTGRRRVYTSGLSTRSSSSLSASSADPHGVRMKSRYPNAAACAILTAHPAACPG